MPQDRSHPHTSRATPPTIKMVSFGPAPQAALRRLLSGLRARGWHDPDETALALLRALQSSRKPMTPHQLARVVSTSFLTVNGISRADLERFLSEMANVPR